MERFFQRGEIALLALSEQGLERLRHLLKRRELAGEADLAFAVDDQGFGDPGAGIESVEIGQVVVFVVESRTGNLDVLFEAREAALSSRWSGLGDCVNDFDDVLGIGFMDLLKVQPVCTAFCRSSAERIADAENNDFFACSC